MYKATYIFSFLLIFSQLCFPTALPEGVKLQVDSEGKLIAVGPDGKPIELSQEQIEELNRLARQDPERPDGDSQEKPERNILSADGTRMLTEEEAQKEQEQLRRQRQRDQLQRNIQDQLRNASGGGGGSRGGGGGGGGGGGSSGSKPQSSKPIQTSDFGNPPDFSKGNQTLEKLIAESQKADPASEQFFKDLQKQLESPPKLEPLTSSLSNQGIPDFSKVINELLNAINSISYQSTPSQKLVENSRLNRRRRSVGRPLPVPSGLGLVSGQSDPALTGTRRRRGVGLAAGIARKEGGVVSAPERAPASQLRLIEKSTHER